MQSNTNTFRRGLMLSACFPLAALALAQPARADQVVIVAAETTAAVVNAEIAAKIATPDRNIALQVTPAGSITSGTVFLFSSPDQGDGAVGFSNAGAIGAVAGDGSITNFAGVQLNGQFTTADNSLTATNSGLITGGFRANNFGGTAAFSNSGTIYNGFTIGAAKDVSLLTEGDGTVGSGTVQVNSFTTTTSTVDGDVTTTEFSSGNAKVVVNDVGTADARGSVFSTSRGITDVAVNGIAGTVNATSNGSRVDTAQAFLPPEAGKTVTTSENSVTWGSGTAAVTLGEKADILSTRARGLSGATVTSDGKVEGEVRAETFGSNSRSKATTTQDADGNSTELTNTSSSTPVGGAVDITLSNASASGSVFASGTGGATVTSDGLVNGGVIANALGTSSSNSSKTNRNADGFTIASESSNSSENIGQTASVTQGATGDTKGSISAQGQAGATATIAGKVGSSVAANSSGNRSANGNARTFNETGGLLTDANSSSSSSTGGPASITVAATGDVAGSLSAFTQTGAASVSVAGKSGSAFATSSGTSSNNSSLTTYDGKGNFLTSTSDSRSTETGGTAAITVATDATVAGSANASGDAGATIAVAGTVSGDASANATGGGETISASASSSSYDADGNFLGGTSSNSSSFTAAAGKADATVAAGGLVEGRVFANGDGDASATVAGEVGRDINVTSQAFDTANSSESANSFDADGNFRGSSSSNSFAQTAKGGMGSLSVATGGTVAGSAFVSGQAGATATVGGTLDGTVSANARGDGSSSSNSFSQTFDAMGNQLTRADSSTFSATATGGNAEIMVADKASVGFAAANGDAGATVSIGGTALNGASAVSARQITALSESSSSQTSVITADSRVVTSDSASASVSRNIGGAASITTLATGLIGSPSGSVFADGLAGVTIVNAGAVRAVTTATSQDNDFASNFASSTQETTVFGKEGALDVTTTTTNDTSRSSNTAVGGNVTGTYSGANGTLNFTPAANGSVNQSAHLASTATVSGAIFGNLTTTGGQTTSSTSASDSTSTRVLDSEANGTDSFTQTGSGSSDRGAGGSSKITITGIVGAGNVGAGNVSSTGSTSSSVAITGGTVDGSVSVNANGVRSTSSESANSYARVFTKGIAATNALDESSSTTATTTAGAASAELTGVGKVGSSLSVSGLSGATVATTAETKVGGSVSASISGTSDSSSSSTRSFVRDAETGIASSLSTSESQFMPSAAGGNASVAIAGTVGGNASASARGKDATATVTGSVAGTVSANTGATATTSSSRTTFDGKLAASGSTSFFGLGIPGIGGLIPEGGKLVDSSTSSTVWSGGKAAVRIATAADLQAEGTFGAGNVSASGVSGASIDITTGSRVSGSATATSGFTNTSFETTRTDLPTAQFSTSKSVQTAVGGPASISNLGEVGGSLSASSIGGATISNSGKSGSVFATSIASDVTTTTVSDNLNTAALRTDTSTSERRAVGGTATITNAANATIAGNVSLAGKTGSFSNSGFVTGTTQLGQSVLDGTETTVRTDASTSYSFMPGTTRFGQTYTVEQSGVSRGFNVSGATASTFNPQTGEVDTLRTSDINATINLNSGSVTLGNITAQTDAKTFERITSTVVNLKGSGWLGADAFAATPPAKDPRTPSLALSEEAQDVFGATPFSAIRVQGVETLQKQGAGTFVIHGQSLVPATTPGSRPVYTLDVGEFAINGGEVQLAASGSSYGADRPSFGIRGNVVNNATLVAGRRVPTDQEQFGASIVGIGPERIEGIHVTQVGNFTQGATGTLVANVAPSLVRSGTVSLNPGGSASEPLGPVTGGVAIPYFTTPDNAGLSMAPSRIDITGNLNLAGTVQANVTRDSLFSDGDGYTLFTYTGTGAVTATVTPTIGSQFVSFGLVNDTAAKTVRLSARRASFTSVAPNSNAAAAAASLDGAVTDIATRIRNDAIGGSGFGTVGELANAQDLANIVSALDWRLTAGQAGELFEQLSSAEIYGSLAAVDQNLVFGQTAGLLTNAVSVGQPLKTRIWLNPVGDFARYAGDSQTGASGIRSDAYGLAFGADIAFSDTGAFGIGGSYAEHDVNARNTPESARIRTWTIGAYAAQGFGDAYVSGLLAYGFSRFDVNRSLDLLSRSVEANFRGTQFDAVLEGGYNFQIGTNIVATPFAELAVRSWKMNAADETAARTGGGVAVLVDEASKSVFSPTIGARIGGRFETASNFVMMPHGRLSYTFQGDIGSDRTVRMVGGGNSFIVQGVEPGGYGTVELGVDTVVNDRINLFVRGGYSFGGGTDIANIRGGISFGF